MGGSWCSVVAVELVVMERGGARGNVELVVGFRLLRSTTTIEKM